MLAGRRLTVGRSFTHSDGRQFGSNWNKYTTDELTALGITYEADPAPVDYRYYYSADNPRPLDDGTDSDGNKFTGVRPDIVQEQKNAASTMLAQTDWYVTRKSETDTAIPEAVTTYRAAVRTACAAREAEIAAVKTTEALETLMKAPATIDGKANAAALTQWPEALS